MGIPAQQPTSFDTRLYTTNVTIFEDYILAICFGMIYDGILYFSFLITIVLVLRYLVVVIGCLVSFIIGGTILLSLIL